MMKCIYCRREFEKSEMTHVRQFNPFTQDETCEYDVCPHCGCDECYDKDEFKTIKLELSPDEYSWLYGLMETTAHLGEGWELAFEILKQLDNQETDK